MSETLHLPQVHEVYDDLLFDNSRNPRQSSETYVPIFKYSPAMQQDQQKWRYFQQQTVDAKNLARYKIIKEHNAYLQFKPAQQENLFKTFPFKSQSRPHWRIVHPKFIKENNDDLFIYDVKRNHAKKRMLTPDMEIENTNETKYSNGELIRKSRNVPEIENTHNDSEMVESNIKVHIRDLTDQTNYLSNRHAVIINANSLKSEDAYKNRKLAQQVVDNSESPQNLELLNSLLGKHPNVQLKGLQQLLASQEAPRPFNLINDYTPIAERQSDPQIKSNQVAEALHATPQPQTVVPLKPGQTLSQLQAHFDALSEVQVQNALAQAHQHAVAEVQAQHQAIILAKSQAEKAALDQIQRAQAQAETLAFIQNQPHNTQPITSTHSQQTPINIKVQHALEHAQKQAQAYQHQSLKTHLPKQIKKYIFKEEHKNENTGAASNNIENEVSNDLFLRYLNSSTKCFLKYKNRAFEFCRERLETEQPRQISIENRYKRDLFSTTHKITKRDFNKIKSKKRRSLHKKRKTSHHYTIPDFSKHLKPETHYHYYHPEPEKDTKHKIPVDHYPSNIIVNINNNNDKPKGRVKHKSKHRPHRNKGFRKPFWRRKTNINKKLHKAFHKLGVPLK